MFVDNQLLLKISNALNDFWIKILNLTPLHSRGTWCISSHVTNRDQSEASVQVTWSLCRPIRGGLCLVIFLLNCEGRATEGISPGSPSDWLTRPQLIKLFSWNNLLIAEDIWNLKCLWQNSFDSLVQSYLKSRELSIFIFLVQIIKLLCYISVFYQNFVGA